MSRSSSDDESEEVVVADSNDSTMNLLRLFEAQPNDHVITRQDLARDYDKSHPRPLSSDGVTTINSYYTWNSSSTNASIHKERATIISALRPVKSTSLARSRPSSGPSSSSAFPTPSKSFTRSHRVQDIVVMCSEVRCSYSAEDHEVALVAVHDHEDADTGGMVGRQPDVWPDLHAATATHQPQRPLFDRDSRCWSCSNIGTDDDDENGTTTTSTAAANRRQKLRPTFKKWNLFTRLAQFKKKRYDGRTP